jgi:hypothetical protein
MTDVEATKGILAEVEDGSGGTRVAVSSGVQDDVVAALPAVYPCRFILIRKTIS